ncbi:MAG: chromosome partitioning protein ParB, partial [Candidatus Chloroheliales bacterium]
MPKGGLGRGLGALIPGGQQTMPEVRPEATPPAPLRHQAAPR